MTWAADASWWDRPFGWYAEAQKKETYPMRVDDVVMLIGKAVRFNEDEVTVEVATEPPTQVTLPMKAVVCHGSMGDRMGVKTDSASSGINGHVWGGPYVAGYATCGSCGTAENTAEAARQCEPRTAAAHQA